MWLQTREHLDFEDLEAEFGRLALRLHNAMLALPNAGRVHLARGATAARTCTCSPCSPWSARPDCRR